MYLMVERGIRGGVSMISQRYAEANDPRMCDTYDPTKPKQTLLYMDVNSLYPHSNVHAPTHRPIQHGA